MNYPEDDNKDKSAASTVFFHDDADEIAYWHSQTPEVRLAAAELMRQIVYRYNRATDRITRVLKIIELKDL